jgi:hypothetical protein
LSRNYNKLFNSGTALAVAHSNSFDSSIQQQKKHNSRGTLATNHQDHGKGNSHGNSTKRSGGIGPPTIGHSGHSTRSHKLNYDDLKKKLLHEEKINKGFQQDRK